MSEDALYFQDWFCKGIADLHLSIYIHNQEEDLLFSVEYMSFFCHQALEKILKSILIKFNISKNLNEVKKYNHYIGIMIYNILISVNETQKEYLLNVLIDIGIENYNSFGIQKDKLNMVELNITNYLKEFNIKNIEYLNFLIYLVEKSYFDVRYPEYSSEVYKLELDSYYINRDILIATIKIIKSIYPLAENENLKENLSQFYWETQKDFFSEPSKRNFLGIKRVEELVKFIKNESNSFKLDSYVTIV